MNWYCIHVRPLKEAQTARFLHDTLALETYFPRLQRRRVIRRVKRLVIEPLFPRYLFCRMELRDHYRAVRYAPEVVNVVHVGHQPSVVDDAIVDDLKSWAGEAVDVISMLPLPQPGSRVEITAGPLRGLEGVFLREMSDQDRVAILLSSLTSNTSVILSRSHFQCVA